MIVTFIVVIVIFSAIALVVITNVAIVIIIISRSIFRAEIYKEEKKIRLERVSWGVEVLRAAAGHPAYKFVMLRIKDF